jgi:hypothetical protein
MRRPEKQHLYSTGVRKEADNVELIEGNLLRLTQSRAAALLKALIPYTILY